MRTPGGMTTEVQLTPYRTNQAHGRRRMAGFLVQIGCVKAWRSTLPASPLEAGSAVLLLWRAAQEMCGLQATVALPLERIRRADSGPDESLRSGRRGRAHRCGRDRDVDDGRVTGARLRTGEIIEASLVLSESVAAYNVARTRAQRTTWFCGTRTYRSDTKNRKRKSGADA